MELKNSLKLLLKVPADGDALHERNVDCPIIYRNIIHCAILFIEANTKPIRPLLRHVIR